MPVWYPSKKMHCIMKAESTKVEFPFLLAAEHDDDVLEIWDQPPSIPLEYLDKRGHLQRPMHTADYFVFRYHECGWVECKSAQELLKKASCAPIGTGLMNMAFGDALLGKFLPPSMG